MTTKSYNTPEDVIDKGLLLTLATALFGPVSFLANNVVYQTTLADINSTVVASGYYDWPNDTTSSVYHEILPLQRLLVDNNSSDISVAQCLNQFYIEAGGRPEEVIIPWVANFGGTNLERLSNAFTSTAFLANKAWLTDNIGPGGRSWAATYDPGNDTAIPSISMGGSSSFQHYLISTSPAWWQWQPTPTSHLNGPPR